MKTLSIFGGSRGIGFAILSKLKNDYQKIYLFDIIEPLELFPNTVFYKFDLFKNNVESIRNFISESNDLIITAGIGQIKSFENSSIVEIDKIFTVNTVSTIKIIKLFFNNLMHNKDSNCMVFSSIAGEVSSPLCAIYGASKAAISKISDSLNIELEKSGTSNRITCIVATAFSGTSFNGGKTNVCELKSLADECVKAMVNHETLHFIDSNLCYNILSNYYKDRHSFGLSSYDYKVSTGRVLNEKRFTIGYLSGTFDLFHIGHLNLLERAKSECDYLIVGVHESGAWKGKETFIPFEERLAIIKSIRFVDKAIQSFPEDSDAWEIYHYDKLFVGSDYKGSERFKKYEQYFSDKNVEVVYFPYTKGTSSTQLREKILKK